MNEEEEGFGNASLGITGSTLGTALQSLLMAGSIEPGTEPSYQLCKTIYLSHPLGAKMVEVPLNIAQSQQREISIQTGPEDRVKQAFLSEWKKLGADKHIFNTMRLSRIYGISAIIYGAKDVPTDKPIPNTDLYKLNLYFNVLDPLNTAGSLVLNQTPNSPDFQKHTNIAVSGQPYHRSRSCVILNEEPIYISYTSSAFGFVGRSVFQRALFPLKSFVQSMITDDLVTKKAGVIVAKIKMPGSVGDRVIQGLIGLKRTILRQAQTGNVINVGSEDSVESLDLTNVDTAMTTARKNILENIAAAASMPALILNNETFAVGFGNGSEDAKGVARYIEGIRSEMEPLYDFFDTIVQYRAWNEDFYKTIQKDFPEYKNVDFTQAFYEWNNSFQASWPSLLIEPESELIKVEDSKMKALISAMEVLGPMLDPENKAEMIQWVVDNLNEDKMIFKHQLVIDIDALKNYVPPMQDMGNAEEEPAPPKPKPKDIERSDSILSVVKPTYPGTRAWK